MNAQVSETLSRWVINGRIIENATKYEVKAFMQNNRLYIFLYAPCPKWAEVDGVVTSSQVIGLRSYAVYDVDTLVFDSCTANLSDADPVAWAADHECHVWRHVLKPLGVDWNEFKSIIPQKEILPIRVHNPAGRKFGFIEAERWSFPYQSWLFAEPDRFQAVLQQMNVSVELIGTWYYGATTAASKQQNL